MKPKKYLYKGEPKKPKKRKQTEAERLLLEKEFTALVKSEGLTSEYLCSPDELWEHKYFDADLWKKRICLVGHLYRKYGDKVPEDLIEFIVSSRRDLDTEQWEKSFDEVTKGLNKQLSGLSYDDMLWLNWRLHPKKRMDHFGRMCELFAQYNGILREEKIFDLAWRIDCDNDEWSNKLDRMEKLFSEHSLDFSEEEIIRLAFDYNASDDDFEQNVKLIASILKEFRGILSEEEVHSIVLNGKRIPIAAINEKKKQTLKRHMNLGVGIRCPVHGVFLRSGQKIIPDNQSDEIDIFFCEKCRDYYAVNLNNDKTITYGGSPIQCIKAVVYNTNVDDGVSTSMRITELTKSLNAEIYISDESLYHSCGKCSRNIYDYQRNMFTVNLVDDDKWNIPGSYCRYCNAITVKYNRVKYSEKVFNADYIKDINLNYKIPTKEEIKKVQDSFNPSEDTVYVYRGHLDCREKGHKLIPFTYNVNKEGNEQNFYITSGDYCDECHKYFTSENEYNDLKISGVAMPNIFKRYRESWGESYDYQETESILKKEGYNVNEKNGLSAIERHAIIVRIINEGILTKGEIAEHLITLINRNGKKKDIRNARAKWEEDLQFVRSYKNDMQEIVDIKHVKRKR